MPSQIGQKKATRQCHAPAALNRGSISGARCMGCCVHIRHRRKSVVPDSTICNIMALLGTVRVAYLNCKLAVVSICIKTETKNVSHFVTERIYCTARMSAQTAIIFLRWRVITARYELLLPCDSDKRQSVPCLSTSRFETYDDMLNASDFIRQPPGKCREDKTRNDLSLE